VLSECKRALVLVIVVTAGMPMAHGQEKRTSGFTEVEFKQLKAKLDIHNQPWATIPWKYSLTEARKLAAATKKPIFMVVGTGNPLGCG
jgi:hypothetical protein